MIYILDLVFPSLSFPSSPIILALLSCHSRIGGNPLSIKVGSIVPRFLLSQE